MKIDKNCQNYSVKFNCGVPKLQTWDVTLILSEINYINVIKKKDLVKQKGIWREKQWDPRNHKKIGMKSDQFFIISKETMGLKRDLQFRQLEMENVSPRRESGFGIFQSNPLHNSPNKSYLWWALLFFYLIFTCSKLTYTKDSMLSSLPNFDA